LFHATLNGLVVSVPIGAPFAKNDRRHRAVAVAAFALTVRLAGDVNVAPSVGLVIETVGGTLLGGPPAAFVPYADFRQSAVAVQRGRDVDANLRRRRRRELHLAPDLVVVVTLPPGTVAHPLPVQHWTSNAITPQYMNVIVGVGSTGAP
jgi:hypothetical protein